jgi:hypothetical protein
MRVVILWIAMLGGCSSDGWYDNAELIVDGYNSTTTDCRTTGICAHNENTDLVVFGGATYLVHRTAESQVLGPNSSLHVLRSTDHGGHWELLAAIPAPLDRDLRDPHFYEIDGKLAIKALTRLPKTTPRDSDVDTIAVLTTSNDSGTTWSALAPIGPVTWSFWRIIDTGGIHYSAAYEDGDKSVVLFSSVDGTTWTQGALIYGIAADTPLETELVVMPSGRMLALVRMDGTDTELLGYQGRLRTKVCWAEPPYAQWDCPQELDGQRLDGPVAFWAKDRLYVVARKHYLEPANRKRTSLFEITGELEGGPIGIEEIGELPSTGDTAYAGVAPAGGGEFLVTWYSSNLNQDGPWGRAILGPTDIWQAKLHP